MATATFDKDIFIDEKATDRIIKVLKKKPRSVPNVGNIDKKSEDALKWLLSNSKKS